MKLTFRDSDPASGGRVGRRRRRIGGEGAILIGLSLLGSGSAFSTFGARPSAAAVATTARAWGMVPSGAGASAAIGGRGPEGFTTGRRQRGGGGRSVRLSVITDEEAAAVAARERRRLLEKERELWKLGNGISNSLVDPGASSSRKDYDNQPKSFNRWLEVEAWRDPKVHGIADIMRAAESTCRQLSRLVKRAQTDDLAGVYESDALNIQGEAQKMLDVVSNTIMVRGMCSPGGMSCVASEEEEFPQLCSVVVDHDDFSGEYAAVFDPLDGSSNIGAGLPTGTIFGILRRPLGGKIGRRTVLQPGNQMVAAGYCLYGASTKLVITMGSGVQGFTLDTQRGEFVLTEPNIRIPRRGKTYSINEANSPGWDERIVDYLRMLKEGKGRSGERYTYRYMGALIADIHYILHEGGIFGYPADTKSANGKLRLLYEANPIGMIMEQAGGSATTGFERILDVRPVSTHHRVPCFLGSVEDIAELGMCLRRPL